MDDAARALSITYRTVLVMLLLAYDLINIVSWLEGTRPQVLNTTKISA